MFARFFATAREARLMAASLSAARLAAGRLPALVVAAVTKNRIILVELPQNTLVAQSCEILHELAALRNISSHGAL
jgi:hypothetical protein